MRECHRGILVFSLLLLASIRAGQGLDLRHSFSSTHEEAEGLTNWSRPLEISNSKVLFSNGIRWDISLEPSVYSSSSRVIPDVHCEKEGLNAVAGSCQKFVYCKDLSDEGLEDWYILLFTCPDEHVFEEAFRKCQHHSAVEEHHECKPKTGHSFLGVQDLTKKDILTTSNFTGKENHPGLVKSSEQNEKDTDDDAHVDWEVPGESELIIKRIENVHYEIQPQSPDISKHNNESLTDKAHDFLGKKYFQEREKRSAFSVQPRGNKADIIAENAKEACHGVKNINKYVTYIINQRSFESTYPKEDLLMSIIMAYNQNLKVAQMNSKSWNEEEGILKSVTDVFDLAREFEPKFKNRFSNINKAVDKILKEEITYSINEIINTLKELINKAEAQIKLTDNKVIRAYLNQSKAELELELTNNIQIKQKVFQELLETLEYVLSNSNEIQEKSSKALRRMEAFRQNIIQDHSKFSHSISRAQDGKRIIEMESEKTLTEISFHKEKKQESEREIQVNRRQIIEFAEEHKRVEDSLQIEMRKLDRMAKEANDRVIAGGVLLAFPILGTIVGAILLGTGIEDKKRALHWKSQTKIELERKMTILKDITAVMNDRVASEERMINSLMSKIKLLETRSISLQVINGILQNMEKSANSVKNSITSAMLTIVSLTNVFSSVEDDLLEIKNNVNLALDAAHQQDKYYFLFENIKEKIGIPWESAKDKIISVGDCAIRN